MDLAGGWSLLPPALALLAAFSLAAYYLSGGGPPAGTPERKNDQARGGGDGARRPTAPSGKAIGAANPWKCAYCDNPGAGICLPASMMKSIGGPVAIFRSGTGGCYHKQM